MEVKDGSWWVLAISRYPIPTVVQVVNACDDDNLMPSTEYVVVLSDPSEFIDFKCDMLGRPYLLKEAWLLCEATSLMKELL
jgi:hypothetical protein